MLASVAKVAKLHSVRKQTRDKTTKTVSQASSMRSEIVICQPPDQPVSEVGAEIWEGDEHGRFATALASYRLEKHTKQTQAGTNLKAGF